MHCCGFANYGSLYMLEFLFGFSWSLLYTEVWMNKFQDVTPPQVYLYSIIGFKLQASRCPPYLLAPKY